jgi:hypothetical protein
MSGAILTVFGSFVTWVLPGGWGTIWGCAKTAWTSAWHWMGFGGNLPGWAILLLSLGSVGFIFLLVVLALVARRAALNKAKASELSFMGLRWRWHIRKHGGMDELIDVVPFCLTCDMQIHPIRFRDVPHNHTKYICDSCPGRPERLKFDGEHDDLVDLVIREAQKQLRQGTLGKTTETSPPGLTPQPGELQETLFEGLRWRWRFQGGELVKIETVCPACDAPLPPYQENSHCPTLYNCRSCRAQIKVFMGTHGELQDRFVRCILRKARGI